MNHPAQYAAETAEKKRTAVIALGGNALKRKEQKYASIEDQRQVLKITATQIASLMDEGWRLAISHGNGPQVGDLMLMSQLAHEQLKDLPNLPLDAANAQTQGSIGYLIAQSISNASVENGNLRKIAALLTQVIVDDKDPAFRNPTKFVGPAYPIEEANKLSVKLGWKMKEDRGRGWRRVVASPKPLEIVELPVIKGLIQQGVSVITVGGGGIPVVKKAGRLDGIAAVIDKDRASSLLATNLGVDMLIIITQVEQVYVNFGKSDQRGLEKIHLEEALRLLEAGQFPPGNMGPKIEAAIDFLKHGGKEVLITDPTNLIKGMKAETGTRIIP